MMSRFPGPLIHPPFQRNLVSGVLPTTLSRLCIMNRLIPMNTSSVSHGLLLKLHHCVKLHASSLTSTRLCQSTTCSLPHVTPLHVQPQMQSVLSQMEQIILSLTHASSKGLTSWGSFRQGPQSRRRWQRLLHGYYKTIKLTYQWYVSHF